MNSPIHNLRPRRQSPIPDVIFALLVANGLLFALQQFNGPLTEYYLALWPNGSGHSMSYDQFVAYWPRGIAPFLPWQLVTYGFLHGDAMHILFNMFMLWMFGREIEGIMGPKRFLIYYLTGVVGAGIVQLVVAAWQGGVYPTIGASGGVFALLLAFGMAFPNRMVMLLFPPIPMRAKYMVVLFGIVELLFGVSGAAPGIAHFAHLGGMLFGYLLLRYWAAPRRRR
jgi:membrane associated rhomboid family serine protease